MRVSTGEAARVHGRQGRTADCWTQVEGLVIVSLITVTLAFWTSNLSST
ncbi:MAG: hypothetical protein H0T13_04945 [Actinobacteria bacterium]|nr:hypothetical protein [Actinomycetota bacterium]